jgi:hypothetical protein
MSQTEKIDLFKLHKDEYVSLKKPEFVETKSAKYLSITGRGAPGGKEFEAKIGALYGMAFTIKMTRKFAGKGDYVVCKLENQMWLDDDKADYSDIDPQQWNWKFLIRTPDFVNNEDLEQAQKTLLEKGKDPEVKQVKFETISEGLCVQMLHVGPYDKEPETVEIMNAFAQEQGMERYGRHHEIYISDPRRVSPERLKTILRMPVRKRISGVL